MKKTKYIILTLVLMFSFIWTSDVSAANANIRISGIPQSIIAGRNFTVTVTVSSAAPLGAWQFDLKYDTNRLQFVRSNTGGIHVADFVTSSNQKTATYTFTFLARSSGTATISIQNASVIGYDEKTMSTSLGSGNVRIMTQSQYEATLSKNNSLKSLEVVGHDLKPSFNKDILEYTVELEPETKQIEVKASTDDSKSRLNGTGKADLKEGVNNINLIVTAENGSQRTYVVKAIVKEYDPITVNIDGKDYNVVRKAEEIDVPNTFTLTTTTINDEEVPSLYSDITDLTLLALKDSEGTISLFIYNKSNNIFTKYYEATFEQIILYPKNMPENQELLKNYHKYKLEIGDNEIDAYRIPRSQFSIIYGLNIITNEEGLYLYDSKENTVQRYYTDEQVVLNSEIDKYQRLFLITSAASIAFGVTSIGLLIFMLSRGSKQKKSKTQKI